ncbi:MAG: transmembrane 220 family protein [Flavobacteriaceae bacterium]
MRLFSKIFSGVFTILFVWAALVQYNDSDAIVWYILYGIAAVASFLFFLGKLNFLIPLILTFAYLIGAWIYWPEYFEGVAIGRGNIDNIEHARESLGLLINALVMLFYIWRIKLEKH